MRGGAIAVVSFEFLARMEQEMAGFSHHLIGFPLALMVVYVAFKIKVERFAGGFDVFQSARAVSLVVMVCMFEKHICVKYFLARWFGVNVCRQ